MSTMSIVPKLSKGTVVGLRSVGVTEAFLEKYIAEDPTVLGFPDVFLRERQRPQDKAGRLDLLLEDVDGEMRYEVELMLGSTDESHLIRTIEYWDIERRKYPAYEHRAVLVAEDIATRFLNVITLFSGSIPIIVIQVNAVTCDDKTAITFIRVVDSTKLRKDDQIDSSNLKSTDRADWVTRVGGGIIELADKCVALINESATRPRSLNYLKYFIGLSDGGRPNNFIYFNPRKAFLIVRISVEPAEPWIKRLEDAGLSVKLRDDRVSVNLNAKDFEENKDLLREILREAVVQDEKA